MSQLNQEEAYQIEQLAQAARRAAGLLARLSGEERQNALLAIAAEIEHCQTDILEANKADLESAQANKIGQSLISRLNLDEHKLKTIVDGVRQIAQAPDPLGSILMHTELDDGLDLYKVSSAIGVIAVIFESRPDALPQIASLCLKSGNATILKGGKEAEQSNKALFDCIVRAAERAGIPKNTFTLLSRRAEIEAILSADKFVDLIIPRGSNQLVRHIQDNTRIPVLGHADGICHIYIDEHADRAKAIAIVHDAKVQYPSACNAVETLLVHKNVLSTILPDIIRDLQKSHVELRLDQISRNALAQDLQEAVRDAEEEDWSTEYCDMIISVKTVSSQAEAIEHINNLGSHHTDAIITESKGAFDDFFAQVNSAGVYWNASTRFADGFRYGFGAEVGISTGKLHPRGPVGVDGLVTYKYKLCASGHTAGEYTGPEAKQFKHKRII
jgi:glutamate-5-semialdehyde dehydrogenase